MVVQAYRARKPTTSPLWQCLSRHLDAFLETYTARYQPRYGFLRPIIPEVVNKFLDCGDLERGFARVRCDHCQHEYLLAFSCKGRWFCPSCHQKKVQLFGGASGFVWGFFIDSNRSCRQARRPEGSPPLPPKGGTLTRMAHR